MVIMVMCVNVGSCMAMYGLRESCMAMYGVWSSRVKLKFSESQYCYANISATKAVIFMKFDVVVN